MWIENEPVETPELVHQTIIRLQKIEMEMDILFKKFELKGSTTISDLPHDQCDYFFYERQV